MPVLRRIWKQGNSDVISIPFYMLEQVGLSRGDYFDVSVISGDSIMLVGKRKETVQHRVQRNGKPFPDRNQ